MSRIYIFPKKTTKAMVKVREEAKLWYEQGFEWDAAVVAAHMYIKLTKLDRRIRRLEGKKCKNSKRRKPKRMRGDVVLLRKSN